MPLDERVGFDNPNFIESHTKNLNNPGYMAAALSKLATAWADIVREHMLDDKPAKFNASGAITYAWATEKYNSRVDGKRYISSNPKKQLNVAFSEHTNYRTIYQYYPNNKQALPGSAYLCLQGSTVGTSVAVVDAAPGNYTYNLATMSLKDFLDTKIPNAKYFAIPQLIDYSGVDLAPKFSIVSIPKETLVEQYGDYIIPVGIDIVSKETLGVVYSREFGKAKSGTADLIDSYSLIRGYGYCGSTANQDYKSVSKNTIAGDYPGVSPNPYDVTGFISECAGVFMELFNSGASGTRYAAPFSFDTTLHRFGYGFWGANTEADLYLIADKNVNSKNTQYSFIGWVDEQAIVDYFSENVGFGVTINNLAAALDPKPNPGNTDDDGQPTNPTDPDPGDGDNDSDDIDYPDPTIIPAAGRKFFALNMNDVGKLTDFLFSETFLNNVKRLWTEPGDYVVDLSYYPIDFLNTGLDFSAEHTVSIGGVTASEISAPELLGGKPFIYMGSFTPTNYYNSYLDYAPYTHLEIFLPYIGLRPLDINQVMGHTICVGYYIDYATQQVLAAIGLDGDSAKPLGQPIAQYTGSIAVHVPLSGQSAQQLLIGGARQVAGAAGAVAGAIGGIATKNVGSIASGAAGLVNSLIPEQVQRREYGSLTAMTGIYSPQQCFLIFDRPIAAEPSGFKEKNGYCASYGGKVSDFNGYLQVSQADITADSTMTQDECDSILNLLQGGIYI